MKIRSLLVTCAFSLTIATSGAQAFSSLGGVKVQPMAKAELSGIRGAHTPGLANQILPTGAGLTEGDGNPADMGHAGVSFAIDQGGNATHPSVPLTFPAGDHPLIPLNP